ncbi:glycoside hydrolase family 3 N-terminal domain-containing protein [Nocardioides marmotae]|uniref:glycoside hydrolase family 3 N-terminal domain-containing protein n=1 Tax=Nocardioides marmotae TaxID=2663857 RepID=UPI00132592E1|nr:glycoside hydrolase family 3 N-terminal domain-containing protein [Nocardioides marmotae]MBC9732017.1 glycosyl hyrolase family 3 [Nocardioides marmotae]MTB83138.1 glycosyl hyrolase family 3 [Nocardioides marmotae]
MRRALPALGLAAVLALGACSGAGDGAQQGSAGAGSGASSSATASSAPAHPDAPTGWGPTEGELAQARALVADWDAARLAGQVIVGRFQGHDAQEAAAMVRDLHLSGLCVTSGNVVDAEQVRALNAAVSEAVAADGRTFPAILGVDQEGGSVSHLRGIATEFPSFAHAGPAVEQGPAGREVVRRAAETTGLELRDLGFTWVFAPVADVTVGAADPTIGTRSPSTDPALASAAVQEAVAGFNAAGIVSTTKHFPGHGSVTADSHESLPVLGRTAEELATTDLPPFEAAVEAQAPAVMIGHLDVEAIDPGVPSSLSAPVYDFLREDVGFAGVTITDSLGMGAVMGREKPAVTALNAGADLLLMPPDTRHTHAVVTEAIETGEVTRERAEEAAAMVVALQLWQQRVADEVEVPGDVVELAGEASRELDAMY